MNIIILMLFEQFKQYYLKELSTPIPTNGDKHAKPRTSKVGMWLKLPDTTPIVDVTKRNLWFTSDWHLGHSNVIKYSDRPFNNATEMNEALVANYNNVVKDDDVCFFIGDFAFLSDTLANQYLLRLNGYKILIVGNHDFDRRKKRLKHLQFDEVHVSYSVVLENFNLCFGHYPINIPANLLQVHGHEHIGSALTSRYAKSKQHINVNCEFYDYCPISFSQLKNLIDFKQQY